MASQVYAGGAVEQLWFEPATVVKYSLDGRSMSRPRHGTQLKRVDDRLRVPTWHRIPSATSSYVSESTPKPTIVACWNSANQPGSEAHS
jgi:hypothetical protein